MWQVNDPDDHMTALRIQAAPRRAGSGGAPHDLADGVALLGQSTQR